MASAHRVINQRPPSVACDEASACYAGWIALADTADPRVILEETWARPFSDLGRPLEDRVLRSGDNIFFVNMIAERQGFTLLSTRDFRDPTDPRILDHRAPVLQSFSPSLTPVANDVELLVPDRENGVLFSAAAIPSGYALVLQSSDLPARPANCETCTFGVFLALVDATGTLLRKGIRVNADASGDERPTRSSLAVDAFGRMVVAFQRARPESRFERDVFVRRIEPDGTPFGPEIAVNTTLANDQQFPAIAAAPDGKFLVAWQSFGQDGSNDGIYARLFAPDGTPLTAERQINVLTRSGQRIPAVAADAAGNFVVTWQDFDPRIDTVFHDFEVKARLLRADGTPVAGEVLVNQTLQGEQIEPQAAFAPNGTLFLAWSNGSTGDPDVETDVRVRLFSASPGEEPCGVFGDQIRCDTGRTGGAPELRLSWGGRPGEVTLFGDWDGDGRDDVCAWYHGRFRCDLDHEGAPAEVNQPFGLVTDLPLLGDVDGDGRAEPCVRRKRRLLCDSGHDGGRPEIEIALGTGRETPLLGDLDGDGKDDLCLFDRGLWTCLTRQKARLLIPFGAPGDLPALGDLDRDGRADLCVLRPGALLCDTAHDGNLAEGVLPFDLPAGSRPLFGNLDGL